MAKKLKLSPKIKDKFPPPLPDFDEVKAESAARKKTEKDDDAWDDESLETKPTPKTKKQESRL